MGGNVAEKGREGKQWRCQEDLRVKGDVGQGLRERVQEGDDFQW